MRMARTSFFVGVCLGLMATPALADSAVISVAVGNGGWQYWSDDEWTSGGAIELAASGVYSFTPEIGVQGDFVAGLRSEDSDKYSGRTGTELVAALHGFFRNESYLIGGFVQIDKTDYEFDSGSPIGFTQVYAGAEAQLYIDDVTLYGTVGVSHQSVDTYDIGTGVGVLARGELRYFVTDDLRLDVRVGVEGSRIDDYDSDMTTFSAGAGVEYKLPESQISLFGTLDYITTEVHGHGGLNTYRAMVGLKFNLGDETLKARDRTGPTLDRILPTSAFADRG